MTHVSQQLKDRGIKINSELSPFMHFLFRELQQIYMVELRTYQLIRRIADRIVYLPLRNAMLNYQEVSKDHLSCLRKLGVNSSGITRENKRTSEWLMLPLTAELNKEEGVERLTDIAMITGIQRIIFYQMAVYRSLCTSARKTYNFQWAASFDDILKDKKMNDSIFSEIALSGVYQVAIES